MKAKRRHDLQKNELAKAITKAPSIWQDWGSIGLAAAIAVLVVVILVRYRMNSNREAAASAIGNLAVARQEMEELERMPTRTNPDAPAAAIASQRRQLFNDANNAIAAAMSATDDHKIQAESLIAKGDLFWTLAMLPPLPGAATQPALAVRDPKDLLQGANEAYETVVKNYSDDPYASIAARFGLAALAENRGDFDAAKTQYDKLALETKDWPAYQRVVSARLNELDSLRRPVRIAQPATAPVAGATPATLPVTIAAPATIPAALGPAKPQAAASRRSVVAVTAPASAPSTHPR